MKNIKIDFLEIDMNDFDDECNVSYIYGKNGTGKTTISREVKKEKIKSFIFNKDYISANIFIDDLKDEQNNTKMGKNQKENSFHMLFGEKNLILNKEINKLKESYEESERKIKDQLSDKENAFDQKIIQIFNEMNMELNYNKTYNELKKEKFDENLKFDEEKKKIIENIANKFKNLDENNKKIEKINNILNFEKINDLITKYNETLNKSSTDSKVYKIHEIASQYKKEKINWMDKDYEVVQIKEYLEKLSKTKKENYDNLKGKVIEKISNLEELIKIQKDFYFLNDNDKKCFKLSANLINELKKINYDKKISNLKIDYNKIESLKEEILLKEFADEVGENQNSMFKKFDEIKILFLKIKKEKNEWENKTKELINSQKELDKKFERKINEVLSKFGINYLKISIETKNAYKNTMTNITLKNKERNFLHLSEGEKSSLALAYFISQLELQLDDINEDFIIFIDDPFDSNDHFKVDSFSEIKLKINDENLSIPEAMQKIENKNNLKLKLIITTHNINVLSSLCINLVNENTCKKNKTFQPIKEEKGIAIYELIQTNEKSSKLNKLNLSHVFPIENNLVKKCEEEISEILKCNISEKNIDMFILLVIFLIKLYDKVDNKRRNLYSLFVYKKIKNKDVISCEDLKKKLEKFDKFREFTNNFNEETCKLIFKKNHEEINVEKLNFKFKNCDDKDVLKEYLKKFALLLNKITLEKNEELKKTKLKRLRHKNNYHSSIIGYAVED